MSHSSSRLASDQGRATRDDQSAASSSPADAILSLRSRSNSRQRTRDGCLPKTTFAKDFVVLDDNTNFAQDHVVPPLPPIPSHFLDHNNRPAIVNKPLLPGDAVRRTRTSSLHRHQRRPTAGLSASPLSRRSLDGGSLQLQLAHLQQQLRHASRSPDRGRLSLHAINPREAARATLEGRPSEMNLRRKGDNDDLFLQVARDESGLSGTDDEGKDSAFHDRVRSRAEKRRSLPADIVQSPLDFTAVQTEDNAHVDNSTGPFFPPRQPHHMSRYSTSRLRAPSAASHQLRGQAVNGPGRSRSGHFPRYSIQNDHSPISPSRLGTRTQSPELSQLDRRRTSFGNLSPQRRKERQQSQLVPQESASESPAESSEPKRSNGDTESVPSQTAASTVWDELDDLKSRIKKLELTGKWPQASNQTTSSDRPRTATTAPTTIDSSPKNERKPDSREQTPTVRDDVSAGQDIASLHPLLHNALTKAKVLLTPSLYRTLEVTANDALQLAAMSGTMGSQGNPFSTASATSGAATIERQLRRKANSMCRNLTDLCLALCEGKHESSNITASPVLIDRPTRDRSLVRHQRESLGSGSLMVRADNYRPVSRLDARRTSLGLQPLGSHKLPLQATQDDASTSEEEPTPASSFATEPYSDVRPASRLLSIRKQTYGGLGGDEDLAVRPPSRAMTDIPNLRKSSSRRDHESTSQERSPTLREALVSRRANAAARDGNQGLSRISSVTSDISRRRFFDRSTPPVLEEVNLAGADRDYSQQSQHSFGRRRITSLSGHQGVRRTIEGPQRTMSLSQRADFIAE